MVDRNKNKLNTKETKQIYILLPIIVGTADEQLNPIVGAGLFP
jgi:hypothetical protein